MTHPLQFHGGFTPGASDGVGGACALLPSTTGSLRDAAVTAAGADDAPERDEIEAYALRVIGANGFGDAALAHTEPHTFRPSGHLGRAARVHAARRPGEIIATALRACAAWVPGRVAAWQRRRRVRETYHALLALDEHTLRDLGIDRTEALSVASELAGDAEATRLHPERVLRGLY